MGCAAFRDIFTYPRRIRAQDSCRHRNTGVTCRSARLIHRFDWKRNATIGSYSYKMFWLTLSSPVFQKVTKGWRQVLSAVCHNQEFMHLFSVQITM